MEPHMFLSLREVTFRYMEQSGHPVLERVSLDIERGKTTVIIGPGGCGKSTLAAVSSGLYPENGGVLDSGHIEICGHPLETLTIPERTRYLSEMFQNPDLQFCMDTLRRELIFCMENLSFPEEVMEARAAEAAAELGLTDLLDRKLHTLSGGEKQKAVLCCLYAIKPMGIFLDEPFANIDDGSAAEIISLLEKWREHRQLTVIAIDHKLDHWLPLADEIIVLGDRGEVVRRGITKDNLDKERELFSSHGLCYPEPGKTVAKKRSGETAEDPAPVLVLKAVSLKAASRRKKEEGEFLLHEASAAFPGGKISAIIGRSGAGKTSLFHAITGRKAYHGSITIRGRELRQWNSKDLFQEMGIVFQNPGSQFITQNVAEEVAQSLKLWGRTAETADLLREYRLERYQKYSPYMLSQGQQRRLAVLSMISGGQRILLLDEPTYGQDEHSIQAIMEQLLRKVREEGLTLLMITHDMNLAWKYADKCYLIEDKKLKEVILERTGGTGWND